MSAEQDKVRKIAERIAHQFESGTGTSSGHSSRDDMAAIRESLAEIQKRLAHLESHVRVEECNEELQNAQASNLNVISSWHPSQERFGIDEAVITDLVDHLGTEKKCDLEPGGKPCDHCSVCSSRGF
jgi:hypothetical protein